MMILFLFLFYFHAFVPLILNSQSVQSNQKTQTCLLPFVTKPCINDGENLSCTFSLDSSERNKTCELSSVSLIFTTSHIELFVISKYYNQIISADNDHITKLILQPNGLNRTYEYNYWFYLRILSIAMRADLNEFVIIHEVRNLDVIRPDSQFNDHYWRLKILPTQCGSCHRTVINMNSITTTNYACPYANRYPRERICGFDYACLNNNPCYFTGYRQLVCQTDTLEWSTRFQRHNDILQYETIFIDVLDDNPNAIHRIQQSAFVANGNPNNSIFLTKHLVFVVKTGILHLSARFFRSPRDFQVRIEHGNCSNRQFVLDIYDDNESSINVNMIDYTSGKTGGSECRLDKNE